MSLKISFVWDWEFVPSQALTWKDGLAAALKELIGRGHEIQIVTCGEDIVVQHDYFPIHVTTDVLRTVKSFDPDVILHWADMTRPNALPTLKLNKPMAICFAGGEALGENVELFDHIFVESEVYKKVFEDNGYKTSIAFGTNTDLFKPIEQVKAFDTIFPATFALWKRHDLYAKATNGLRSLACGYMYHKHEQECWQVCLDNNVTILPHVSADVLHYLYASSKICVIPSLSSGGSQRTVLEAMAMNIPLIVCDSDKFDYVEGQDVMRVAPNVEELREAIQKSLTKEVNTREYILKNWSHINYANALEEGLKSII